MSDQAKSAVYAADGVTNTHWIDTSPRVRLHEWSAESPKASILLVHGICAHARFDYLHHPQLEDGRCVNPPLKAEEYRVTYAHSWTERLNRQGMDVYGIDLQGHGDSESWADSRCNVEAFDNLGEDVLKSLAFIKTENAKRGRMDAPVFIMGISLGGCVVTRSLLLASQRGQMPVQGAVLLAPALSIERLKEKFINRIFMQIGGTMSRWLPHLAMAKKEANTMFPDIESIVAMDPMTWKGEIRIRIAWELVQTIEKVHAEAATMLPDLSLVICHSEKDTMCDPDGSTRILKEMPQVTDKTLWEVNEMWHFLTKEPGSMQLLERICGWFTERITKPTSGGSGKAASNVEGLQVAPQATTKLEETEKPTEMAKPDVSEETVVTPERLLKSEEPESTPDTIPSSKANNVKPTKATQDASSVEPRAKVQGDAAALPVENDFSVANARH